jgi:hypothetical protein
MHVGLWGEDTVNSLMRTVAVSLSAGALAMAATFGTAAPNAAAAPNGGALHAQSCNDATTGGAHAPVSVLTPKACPGPSPIQHH